MRLSEKVAVLLNYIAYNTQDNYLRTRSGYGAQQELRDIAQALQNGTEETDPALLARYRQAVDHLVHYYLSNKYISPLMFATRENQVDLMKDILATPRVDIDEAFNHRVKARRANVWFGTHEWVEENGPEHGYTALVYAAKERKLDALNLLIKHYANPHQIVKDNETVLDVVGGAGNEDIHALLDSAYHIQAHALVEALISCTSEEQLNAIIQIQKRLEIGKGSVIEALMNFYADDQSKQIRLLEQATDYDEFNNSQNFLAEYVKRSQGILAGKDDEFLKLVMDKLNELTASPAAKPEIKEITSSAATVEPVMHMLKYGPQYPKDPTRDKVHPAYTVSAVNSSL